MRNIREFMPHLLTNRPRRFNLFSDAPPGPKQFYWESANAILYLIGGLTFMGGSVFFFPEHESHADIGAWSFFAGSIMYLVVTGYDLLESIRHMISTQHRVTIWNRLECFSTVLYVSGTILFAVGSLLFLSSIGLIAAGAWCFIVGSFLFVIGACISVMQIIQAGGEITLQLMNATAITFILGAALFLVASIPYLWEIPDSSLKQTIFYYAAWEYVVGSFLFFAGGGFNFFRAKYAMAYHHQRILQHHHR
jgi:hypothetical protein